MFIFDIYRTRFPIHDGYKPRKQKIGIILIDDHARPTFFVISDFFPDSQRWKNTVLSWRVGWKNSNRELAPGTISLGRNLGRGIKTFEKIRVNVASLDRLRTVPGRKLYFWLNFEGLCFHGVREAGRAEGKIQDFSALVNSCGTCSNLVNDDSM